MNGKNGTVKWLIGLSFTIIIMIVSLTLNIVNRVRESAAVEYRLQTLRRIESVEELAGINKDCLTTLRTQMETILQNQDEMKRDIKELIRSR